MRRIRRFRAQAGALALLAILPLPAAAPAERPALAGRVIAADGGPLGPMRVVLRQGSRAESAPVMPDGRFVVAGPGAGGAVEVVVDAAAGAPRRFHPSAARVHPDSADGELRVVVIPRSWTIRAGKYAGRPVEVSLERAFAPACPGCSSYFRAGVRDVTSGRRAPSATWPAGVFPLRVAFTGETPFQRVTARDSAVFWRLAAELEAELGRDLLRPATYAETLPDARGAPEDVILVESDPRLRRVGWGSTISQTGDIIYGAIRVRDPGVFSGRDGPRLVKHELLHALGVGHTCAWRSVMAQLPECSARGADAPTPEDVAYYEVLSYTRELQRAHRAQLGLEASLRGERMFSGNVTP